MRNGHLMLMVMRLLPLWLVGFGGGCGGGGPSVSRVPDSSSLHGGILIALPENQGFVELLNDRRERRGNEFQTRIVAYLLQADQKTAATQPAKSLTVKLGAPPAEKAVVMPLEPDRADPVGGARYVSGLGPFQLEQSGGEIRLDLGGKTLAVPFRGPR
jgi:hypothetical protein